MTIRTMQENFSVCLLPPQSEAAEQTADRGALFFLAQTSDERSLVCETRLAPASTLAREDGWKAMYVEGPLDFSLLGILADISALLAQQKISIFAVSTYKTDYILTKAADFERAWQSLAAADYRITHES